MSKEESGIKVGDAVYHVSSTSTIMGVEQLYTEKGITMAFCSWLDKNKKKETGEFNVAVLRKQSDNSSGVFSV